MSDVIPLLKFTPSAQDPAVLETITVQREPLIAKLVESALDVGGGLRHQLLIGPRGMGKTHILSLVASRVRADPRAELIATAWLDEDPWAIRTYEKFIAAIVASVAEEIGDGEMAATATELRARDDSSGLAGQELLRGALGEERLLLLVENLDQIFRRIGDDGQAKFRAFAEDWRQMLILGTSPQIFEGIQLHESPFYGFFAITHLEELSLASAAELMKRVAELRGDSQVLRFLATETATQRLTAIEALAGGHPRIWLLLSGCVSIAAIEELVPMFLEALDELTPYYQDRLRELGDQQQELIVLLSEDGGALSNRVLAERSGISQNQVASMLRNLTERGYVRRAKVPVELSSGGDSRLSFWELREPLMRLCLDVKQARGKPLRMVVEFLRAWYGPGLLDELVRLPASAQLATTYASEAFRMVGDDLSSYDLFQGSSDEILARAERGLSLLPESEELKIAKATGLMMEGRSAEAAALFEKLIDPEAVNVINTGLRLQLALIQDHLGEEVDAEKLFEDLQALREANPDDAGTAVLEAFAYGAFGSADKALETTIRALEFAPDNADLHANRGGALRNLGRHEDALEAFTRATELDPTDASFHGRAGITLGRLGRDEEALAALERSIELDPELSIAHGNRGVALGNLGRHEDALAAFVRAVELNPGSASAQRHLAVTLMRLGRHEDALAAFVRAEEFAPDDASIHNNKGVLLGGLGRPDEALAAFAKASELSPRDPVVLMNYAVGLGIAERHEEALRVVGEVVDITPDNAAVQGSYAAALSKVGRHEDALEAFARAIELDPQDPVPRFKLAETILARGDGESGLAALREALASWQEKKRDMVAGEPDLLCRILWQRYRNDPVGSELIVGVVEAYAEAGAAEELGRGIVNSIPLFVDDGVSASEAATWVESWTAASSQGNLEIPLNIARAALAWKQDEDRAHLLALPLEQREILVGLLTSKEAADGGGD